MSDIKGKSRSESEEWIVLEEEDAHVDPEFMAVAGKPTLPRASEPSIWHQLAWDEDYAGPVGVAPLPAPDNTAGVTKEVVEVATPPVKEQEEEEQVSVQLAGWFEMLGD